MTFYNISLNCQKYPGSFTTWIKYCFDNKNCTDTLFLSAFYNNKHSDKEIFNISDFDQKFEIQQIKPIDPSKSSDKKIINIFFEYLGILNHIKSNKGYNGYHPQLSDFYKFSNFKNIYKVSFDKNEVEVRDLKNLPFLEFDPNFVVEEAGIYFIINFSDKIRVKMSKKFYFENFANFTHNLVLQE